MKCPYCEKEMKKGILSGDGRTKVRWKEGNKKADIWDTLSFKCNLSAIRYSLCSFTAEAWFCHDCNKMIIETDVVK